jgi:hypothetical protein
VVFQQLAHHQLLVERLQLVYLQLVHFQVVLVEVAHLAQLVVEVVLLVLMELEPRVVTVVQEYQVPAVALMEVLLHRVQLLVQEALVAVVEEL